ncbi:hypothetical protein CLOLEP_02958 [[Clostridium] leptum DSM 753]|uniref:Uncharacterized protein n=1 Tax=[Clostridium] leptum DSM 753 TaxID=428125 RepID=A7VWJ2_9FIRM|nr:hypothetical protein CLOLEP_02958 [[Clostridium] leptum DSM 753]
MATGSISSYHFTISPGQSKELKGLIHGNRFLGIGL